eukprot:NODE_321_length_9805_cov_0.700185.p11 type:complete len:104 gc:universal NODE_321_length_9805_cov_0.700185:2798-2487(-)
MFIYFFSHALASNFQPSARFFLKTTFELQDFQAVFLGLIALKFFYFHQSSFSNLRSNLRCHQEYNSAFLLVVHHLSGLTEHSPDIHTDLSFAFESLETNCKSR